MSYIEEVNIFINKNKNKKKKKKIICEEDECIPKRNIQYNPSNRVFIEPNKPNVYFQPNTNKNTFSRSKPYKIIRSSFKQPIKQYKEIDESIVAPLFYGGQRRIQAAEKRRKEITEELRKKYAYEEPEESKEEEIQQESKEDDSSTTSDKIKKSIERIRNLSKKYNSRDMPNQEEERKAMMKEEIATMNLEIDALKSKPNLPTKEEERKSMMKEEIATMKLERDALKSKLATINSRKNYNPSMTKVIPKPPDPDEEEKEEINFLEKQMKPQLSILKKIGEKPQQEPLFLGGGRVSKRVLAIGQRLFGNKSSSDEDIGAEQYELEEMLGENYAGRELTEETLPQDTTIGEMYSNIYGPPISKTDK
jgi:hypothetical protein